MVLFKCTCFVLIFEIHRFHGRKRISKQSTSSCFVQFSVSYDHSSQAKDETKYDNIKDLFLQDAFTNYFLFHCVFKLNNLIHSHVLSVDKTNKYFQCLLANVSCVELNIKMKTQYLFKYS